MSHEPEFVCFCLARRHPNVFAGRRLPSNCRYCNAAMDLNSILPREQAEARGLLKMPEEPAPGEETGAAEPQPAPSAPQGFGGLGRAPQPPVNAQPTAPQGFGGLGRAPQPPVNVQPTPPQGFGGLGRAPQPPASAQPTPPQGFGGLGRAPQPPASAQPTPPQGFGGLGRAPQPPVNAQPTPPQGGFVRSGFGMPSSARPAVPAQEWQLDYFGEKIAIPQEGGWVGRAGVASQWLLGYPLVSREHVRVAPAQGGLEVGPNKSLNGTFVTVGGARRELGPGETATLSAGDILWLYNLPLQVEKK